MSDLLSCQLKLTVIYNYTLGVFTRYLASIIVDTLKIRRIWIELWVLALFFDLNALC